MVADRRAHDGFGEVTQSLPRAPDFEEVLVGVDDLVLDDPLDLGDVEVAGEHQRDRVEVRLAVDRALPGHDRAEAELLLELTLDGLHPDLVDEGDAEMDARTIGPDVLAEPENDGSFLRPDDVDGLPCEDGDNQGEDAQDDPFGRELGHLRHLDLRTLARPPGSLTHDYLR